MDFGCITPEYVYRMWGGSVAIDEIATGLTELRKDGSRVVVHDEWFRGKGSRLAGAWRNNCEPGILNY